MAAVPSVVVADRVLGHKMVTREAPTCGGRQGMVPLGASEGWGDRAARHCCAGSALVGHALVRGELVSQERT
jgi:hypothetical protein